MLHVAATMCPASAYFDSHMASIKKSSNSIPTHNLYTSYWYTSIASVGVLHMDSTGFSDLDYDLTNQIVL